VRLAPLARFVDEYDPFATPFGMDPFSTPDTDAVPDTSELRRYWSDPSFAAAIDAEQAAKRAQCHAHYDAIRDRDLIRLGYIDAPRSNVEDNRNGE
jgi:hypothetical protein